MADNIFYAGELTLTCAQDYQTLTLLKNNHEIGRKYSPKQAYHLCISILRTIDRLDSKGNLFPTFEITSNALVKLRDFELENRRKPFEEVASLERAVVQ